MKDHQSVHRDWRLAYDEAYASEADARERTTIERLRQRKTIVAETNHAESADGLK